MGIFLLLLALVLVLVGLGSAGQRALWRFPAKRFRDPAASGPSDSECVSVVAGRVLPSAYLSVAPRRGLPAAAVMVGMAMRSFSPAAGM
ncbi:hypothetical protein [Streptomyces phaeoluteigriseus]|nr:hypothetical protein [Streptomyces phaeoluteigriseus]